MSKRFPRLCVRALEARDVPASGVLDTTFSGDGLATVGLTTNIIPAESATATALQADGKLLVAGYAELSTGNRDVAVYRYNTDGTLDSSFGTNGRTTFDFNDSSNGASGIAIQGDGSIVVCVPVPVDIGITGFGVARLTSTGVLDTSFDGDGKFSTFIVDNFGTPTSSRPYAVTIDSSGRAVIVGETIRTSGFLGWGAIRLTTSGSLDSTFSGDGKLDFDFGSFNPNDIARAVVPSGSNILIGGESRNNSFRTVFTMVRLTDSGAFDGSFGAAGIVLDDFPSSNFNGAAIRALTIQSDNKIVAAGAADSFFGGTNFAIARYSSTGAIDTTFGEDYAVDGTLDGKADHDFFFGTDSANSIAITSTNRYVLAGTVGNSQPDFGVARLNVNGTLDTSFAAPNGFQTVDFGSATESVAGMAIRPGGQIVIAGTTSNNNGDFAIAQLNASGSFDTTFDGDGRVAIDYGPVAVTNSDFGYATLALPDGKLIVAGTTGTGGVADFALTRLNRDGTVDPTFGDQGSIVLPTSAADEVRALVRQPDGKILAAGYSGTVFSVARFTADGLLDPTFDGDGRVNTDVSGGFDGATAMTLQGDGKIVVAGYGNGQGGNFAIVRYLSNGMLDSSFDFDGKLVDTGGNGNPVDVVIDSSNRIIVGGPNGLIRYLPDGRRDTSLTSNGVWTKSLDTRYQNWSSITGIAVQTDGKIILTAQDLTGNRDFAVSRLLVTGAADTTYGTNAIAKFDFATSNDNPTAGVSIQADGKVVVAGTGSGANRFAVARLTTTGALDATFGTGGRMSGTFGTSGTLITDVSLQSNGKVNLTGVYNTFVQTDSAVAQIRGDNTLPTSVPIGNVNVNEDATPTVIDLYAVFADAQDTDVELTYQVISNTVTNGAATTGISNGLLTLTYPAHLYGSGSMTIRATDLDGGVNEVTFGVTVSSVNDLPITTNDTQNLTDQAGPTLIAVLANDSDADVSNPAPDADIMTLTSATGATLGTVRIVSNQIEYTPRRNAQGTDVITYTVADRFGGTATGTLTVNVTDVTAPAVAEVRYFYAPNRYIMQRDLYRVYGWSSITRVDVRFTEPMVISQGDLTLTGVTNGLIATTAFSYSPATMTASWRFDPLLLDRYLMQLPVAGAEDEHGNQFAAAPSRRFGVLPGDLDGNGLVTAAEAATVKRNLGKRYVAPPAADVNGDGVVTLADYNIALSHVNRRVP